MPIATPEVYSEMLDRAKADRFAYPAINVTSSETLNAALRGLAEAESDGIVQLSTGGSEFASGGKVKDMVVGSVAMAEFAQVVAAKYPVNVVLHTDHCPENKLDTFVRPLIAISQERVARGEHPLFQSHMWDGSATELHRNLAIAAELLAACAKAKIVLEVEIGVVGGEEDGVANDINEKLYTTAEDFEHTVDALGGGERGRYLLAATFGNVHGVAGVRFLLNSDPPDHTKLRRLVTKPFTPSGIASLEPRLRAICDELVDDLITAGADGPVDLIERLGPYAPARPAEPRRPRRPHWPTIVAPALALILIAVGLPFLLGDDEIVPEANSVARVDPADGSINLATQLDARPGAAAAGFDSIWVVHPDRGFVSRLDAADGDVKDTIRVGGAPTGIAIGEGSIWVTNSADGTVSRISPDTNEETQRYEVGSGPSGIAVGGGISRRLLAGWVFGTLVSVIGMVGSATLDLPTGATVVCAFGVSLLLLWACVGPSWRARPRRNISGAATATSRRPGP